MPQDLFFLCDLTHTGQVINSDVVPYPLGCIKSHFLARSQYDVQVELFKYPHRLSEEFRRQSPSLVGFSNYSWNSDLAYSFAKAIKRTAPDTLIVFGGPNYPLERHRQQQWLSEHPDVDVYLVGEAEEPFVGVAETWLEKRSIDGWMCTVCTVSSTECCAGIRRTVPMAPRTCRESSISMPRLPLTHRGISTSSLRTLS